MAEMISRDIVIGTIENCIHIHKAQETDSELIKAYEAGQRDALEQMKMEIQRLPTRKDVKKDD